MVKQTEIDDITSKIQKPSIFNEMGDWTMVLNKMDIVEAERRALFYQIDFPFNAKAEFINGRIFIQEYPLTDL